MTKRLLVLAGFCVAIIAANYLYLRADEVQKAKPAAAVKEDCLAGAVSEACAAGHR